MKYEEGGRRELESTFKRAVEFGAQLERDSFIRNMLSTSDLSVQQIANYTKTNPEYVMEIREQLQEQSSCPEQSESQTK